MKLRQGTVVDKSNLKRVKLFLLANQVDLFLALKVNLLKVQYASCTCTGTCENAKFKKPIAVLWFKLYSNFKSNKF